jgi:hypothetical protein
LAEGARFELALGCPRLVFKCVRRLHHTPQTRLNTGPVRRGRGPKVGLVQGGALLSHDGKAL